MEVAPNVSLEWAHEYCKYRVSARIRDGVSRTMERAVGISVRKLLADPGMNGAALLAGENGIDNIISKANIYADKDILDWIFPHEILLMTELNYKDWDEDSFIEFMRTCTRRRLAALGIKFTRGRALLPNRVIIEADRLGLPLLALDRHLSIGDTSSLIFQLIFSQQAETLEKHGLVHEQLLKSLLEEGKVEAVLNIIQSHIENPIGFQFADLNNPILLMSPHTCAGDPEKLSQALRRDMANYVPPVDIGNRADERQVQIGDLELTRIALPVVYKEATFGMLFVWGQSGSLDSFTLYTMETAATNIALLMLQELSLQEVEVKHSSEYFSELLNPATRRSALEKARIYKLNPDNQFAVLIVRIVDAKDRSENVWSRDPAAQDKGCESTGHVSSRAEHPQKDEKKRMDGYVRLHAQREFIYDFIFRNIKWAEQTMREHQLSGLIATEKNEICVMVDCEKMHGDKQPLIDFATALQEGYQALLPIAKDLMIQIGIGKIYTGLRDVVYSYREASKTIDLGVHLYNRPILHFDDLGIFKIFIHVTDVEELEEFYRLTLTPLLEYDKRKQTQLLTTLACYFVNNCNVRKTSEELFTHYNTILYRLERIQEITGMNLEDSNDRLNLEMALKMRSLFPDY